MSGRYRVTRAPACQKQNNWTHQTSILLAQASEGSRPLEANRIMHDFLNQRTNSDEAASYPKYKRFWLLGIVAWTALFGAVTGALPAEADFPQPICWISVLGMLFMMFSWCQYDALQRGYRMSRALRVGLVLVWLLAFPFYVFRTRGLAGFKTIALTLLFAGGLCAVAIISALLTSAVAALLGDGWHA